MHYDDLRALRIKSNKSADCWSFVRAICLWLIAIFGFVCTIITFSDMHPIFVWAVPLYTFGWYKLCDYRAKQFETLYKVISCEVRTIEADTEAARDKVRQAYNEGFSAGVKSTTVPK